MWTLPRVVTHIVPSHVCLRQSPKPVPFRTCLDNLLERQIHPSVTVDEMAIERFAILELNKHGVALGRCEQA